MVYSHAQPAAIAACLFCITADLSGANLSRGSENANQFGVHEIVLTGNASARNPFATVCKVRFKPPSPGSREVTVDAFYDGGNLWRARLYVSEAGRWSWVSAAAADTGLNGKSGSFQALASNLCGKLQQHPANRRQWRTNDGRTFLNLSDTAYILFRSPRHPIQPVDDSTFQAYVKDDVKLGVTSLRAGGCGGYAVWDRIGPSSVSDEYDRSNWCWEAPYDPSGANRYWERFDLDRLQTTDRRLEWLLNHYPDLYIQLIMFSKSEGDLARMWFAIPEQARRQTVAYLLARWSAWPQVHFLIVNDTPYHAPDNEDNTRMVREIGQTISRLEPFGTLVSAGAKRRVDNPFLLAGDWKLWHTYLHIEKYSEIDASVCDYYYGQKQVPVHLFYGEDWYEQDQASKKLPDMADPDYYHRRMFWSVLLSGGSPNYGGRFPVLQPYSRTTGAIRLGSKTYHEPLRGLNSVIHIKRFLEERGIDLALFQPDDGAAKATPVPVPEPDGPSRAQCSRKGRDEYLVYLPCARDGELSGGLEDSEAAASRLRATLDPLRRPQVTVDLRGAGGQFVEEWYRASDGAIAFGGVVAGGSYHTTTSPWAGADVLLRLKRQTPFSLLPTQIISHRGGAGQNPENTLPAFADSLRSGISIEMDVRKTQDGQLIVIHDRTTGRTCDRDMPVAQSTLADLQTLDAAFRFDPKSDGTFPLRAKNVRLPSLREVFMLFTSQKRPGAMLSVELKDGDDHPVGANQDLYQKVIGLIGEFNLWEAAHVEVSGAEEAEALRLLDPRIRTIYWGRKPDDVFKALQYPFFVRIGVGHEIAFAVAARVKAAGRKLNITGRRFSKSDLEDLSKLRPDSLGVDHYSELLQRLP